MMTMQDVLTDLAAAQRALQRSSVAFDEAIEALHETLTAVGAANRAQGEAIGSVIAATEKALQLVATNRQH
jgi:hypothetical protein